MVSVYPYWLSPFGWGIFFIGLVLAIILFAIKKKFAPVMHLVSVATYIFTIGFISAAFDIGKNGVLLLLALSAVIFISLGFYFSSKSNVEKEKFASKIPSKR
ncbi:hypothetical protein COU54_02695 [Candidatus Pacearchaeota archaeon CG10_big_fil_rev_8_21_14_0_10_31_24]|nr:MAG: hypothetical protein COU54_02695 [Candidatus Pacearchaeota archaeon CG10_big_fil_rev_8_21_14_0_10_31_24]